MIRRQKECYQSPSVELFFIQSESLICVSGGGSEGTGDEDLIPIMPLEDDDVISLDLF